MSGQSAREPAGSALFSGKALLWLAGFCLLLAAVLDQTRDGMLAEGGPALVLGVLGLVALVAVLLVWWHRRVNRPARVGEESLGTEGWLLLMVAAGFLLRLWYVLYTPVTVRQHDVFFFGAEQPMTDFYWYRHAEYIEYICRYLRFPQVDPTAVGLSQLYHPPFHHLLAGLWLRLQTALGSGYARAVESIQLLTLLYSSAAMLLCARLFRLLGLTGKSLLLATAIVCFHPTFLLLSGSVNNDMLSVALGLAALVAAIEWYRAPSVSTILPVALTVGLSMMTKLSGGLLAPGIAVVFLWRAGRDIRADRKSWRRYLGQFALFAVVCVPLALWWQTRNLLLYGTPPTFVPGLSENSGQYIGDYTVWQRLFGLSADALKTPFEAWTSGGAAYNEYNLFLGMFQTAAFDEGTFFAAGISGTQTVGLAASYVLLYSQIALALMAVMAMAVAVVKKRFLHSAPVTAMLVVCWLVLLWSYVSFCFGYPQTCTQNFRYLVPTLVIGAAFLGQLFGCLRSRVARYGLGTLTGLFCGSSAVVYALLGVLS